MPGYHLPFFGAVASGLFADHGLDVEILDPPPGPDMNISHRVAEGGADFSLTGVTYHLFAHRDAGYRLKARFVSVLQQRAGLSAVVPEASDLRTRADLPGRRLARSRAAWLADECVAALATLGLGSPVLVAAPDGPAAALASGDVDMVATFVDTVGVAGRAGFPVRAIHVGRDIYGSGLIAGDGVASELVRRVVAAVAAAFDEQRAAPDAGVRDFCERFPYVEPHRASRSWSELEPFAFSDSPTGSMTSTKWRTTIQWLSAVHGLDSSSLGAMVRPEACRQPSLQRVASMNLQVAVTEK